MYNHKHLRTPKSLEFTTEVASFSEAWLEKAEAAAWIVAAPTGPVRRRQQQYRPLVPYVSLRPEGPRLAKGLLHVHT